jgi:hypothetical protein
VRGRLAADVKRITDHSDAPDIDAFGGYWNRIYQDCGPYTLLEALPSLCDGIGKACREYGGAVREAHTQASEAVSNPIGIIIEAAAVRAALASAAGKLLQTVGVIAAGALASHLVASVTTGTANAPNLRILQAEVEGEQEHPHGAYKPSGKHKPTNTRARRGGDNSKEPEDGQEALDNSVQVKDTSPRRVGYDEEHGEIVVLDETQDGEFHGDVRSWKELTQEMKNTLIRAKQFNRRGKYIGSDE